jgi:hypothetical protein
MNLWTEYEGRTIDGVYPLTKLIRPEGRSAFFSTSNGTGVPTVIRLIESHFDGDQILTRWRGVAALNHPNLVKLKKFGHVVVDETTLVYAVMEPVDANLGELLKERRLTELETKQLATSLMAAIGALHSSGFVHEHVAAENVLAVGETIKLRSDCIRETLEGEEGVALRRKDVRDYATVLLQALTQQTTLEGVSLLPGPFEQIVRKGMSGEWGFSQISVALKPTARVGQALAAAQEPVAPAATSRTIDRPSIATKAPAEKPAVESPRIPPSVARRIRVPADAPRGLGTKGIAYGVGTFLIILLGWYFVHSRSASSKGVVPEATAPAPVVQQAAPVAEKNSAATPVVPRTSAVTASVSAPTGSNVANVNWRVVAFTYNQEEQAKQKAAEIAQSHPDLSPSVFTPNGHAPFLVTLGGQMSKQDAFAFSGKAKREGMPKDTYAQNYRAGGN